MAARPVNRRKASVPAASGARPERGENPVLAGVGAEDEALLGRAPESTQCPTCKHWQVRVPLCVCGESDLEHALAGDGVTRKACSASKGPQGTRCGCTAYTPNPKDRDELPDLP